MPGTDDNYDIVYRYISPLYSGFPALTKSLCSTVMRISSSARKMKTKNLPQVDMDNWRKSVGKSPSCGEIGQFSIVPQSKTEENSSTKGKVDIFRESYGFLLYDSNEHSPAKPGKTIKGTQNLDNIVYIFVYNMCNLFGKCLRDQQRNLTKQQTN